MSYSLPFKETDKIIELGGGNYPLFHPNLDIRQEPNVDIVADLNEPLPILDNEWDGVYSSFQLEHLSWRKIRKFFKKVFRILKPDGKAVFITANLLEQARILTEVPSFTDEWVGMIFGDNDYPENTHRAGFSPDFACRLFREAGFERITIIRHPNWRGDMIIEASKPQLTRQEMFDKHYFHGGQKVGGYAHEGYRDFNEHWVTYQKILDLEPKNVLELGCARGFILKRLNDTGIPTTGLEISKHCFLTRCIDNIITHDICQTPWPIAEKSIDLCFSVAVLEHIPEEFLPNIIKELERVSIRGIHGIDFGQNDDGFDQTHCTLRPQEWWQQRMPASQMVVDKESLESLPENTLIYDFFPKPDGLLKANIGCFTNMFHNWVNIDILPLHDFAKQNKYKFMQKDVREGLPFVDQSVDLLYSSHFIEHLTYEEAFSFLKECRRVLKTGGVFRLMMPDAELLVDKYYNAAMHSFDEISHGPFYGQLDRLWSFLCSGHKSAYDFNIIQNMAKLIGFEVKRQTFQCGHPEIVKETIDMLPDLSLFVELS